MGESKLFPFTSTIVLRSTSSLTIPTIKSPCVIRLKNYNGDVTVEFDDPGRADPGCYRSVRCQFSAEEMKKREIKEEATHCQHRKNRRMEMNRLLVSNIGGNRGMELPIVRRICA